MKSIRSLAGAAISTVLLLPTPLLAQAGGGLFGGEQEGEPSRYEEGAASPQMESSPSAEFERGRMGGEDQQIKQQVSEDINSMVLAAAQGKPQDFARNLAKGDQLEKDLQDASIQAAQQFQDRWQQKYGESFDKSVKSQQANLQIGTISGNTASATLATPEGDIPLQLTKEQNKWQISAPSGLDAGKLKTDLQQANSELQPERFSWPQNKQQAYNQVVYKYLQPLSTSEGERGTSAAGAAGSPSIETESYSMEETVEETE